MIFLPKYQNVSREMIFGVSLRRQMGGCTPLQYVCVGKICYQQQIYIHHEDLQVRGMSVTSAI